MPTKSKSAIRRSYLDNIFEYIQVKTVTHTCVKFDIFVRSSWQAKGRGRATAGTSRLAIQVKFGKTDCAGVRSRILANGRTSAVDGTTVNDMLKMALPDCFLQECN